ncbi:uncharacterized protein DUF3971 [Geothermobacter ehrlichii]|uniref:Uncharacterized protein DUF3971 n=1 Tax=Geothermobacter ehrlichii TaxID=213224 RepID=A0A5D3WK90_9BACT|nr:AsmA-like C-terminal domain-containing protein [Geothermobacter ehrlichii]TYO98320.1 uncharacterized protein DUF3971 [Geothermobacter ehrlichii]
MARKSSRQIARIIILLFCLGALGLSLFLATFDLNRYRGEIESALSDLFRRPVRFASIRFSVTKGLAIDCNQLVIGKDASDTIYLQADHLYIKVGLLPLLQGQLTLRKIILARPQLVINLDRPQKAGPAPPADSGSDWSDTGLSEIRIHDGAIELRFPRKSGYPPLRLTGADLGLGARPDGRLDLVLDARLEKERLSTPLHLEGIVRGDSPLQWGRNPLTLALRLHGLPLDAIDHRLLPDGVALAGRADLDCRLQGNPNEELAFDLDLAADSGSLMRRERPPLPLGRWRLQGTWRRQNGTQSLAGLTLNHGRLRLNGELQLDRDNLAGQIRLAPLALDELRPWLPQADLPRPTGTLGFDLVLPRTPWTELTATGLLRRLRGEFRLADLALPLEKLPPLEQGEARLRLADSVLSIERFTASWQGRTQQLQGRVDLTGDIPTLELNAELSPPLTALLQKTGMDANRIDLNGPLPVQARINGPLANPRLAIEGDLTRLTANLGGWFRKQAGEAGTMKLQLQYGNGGWTIERGRITLAATSVDFNGSIGSRGAYSLHLSSDAVDLRRLGTSRHLAWYRLRGTAGLDLQLAGSADRPLQINGRITLQNAGTHLTSILADLDRIKGTFLFHGRSFDTVLLNARLGDSPVTIQARLADFDRPRLELRLQGRKVRADELIFKTTDNWFHNLDAELAIDGDGIRFKKVAVRLDGGTDCVVSGAMLGWKNPQVQLQANAAWADIDEIIGLWRGPAKAHSPAAEGPPASGKKSRQGTLVTVEARVARGRFGRLNFTEAAGTVTSDGRGLLTVFPLHFRAREGYATGMVISDGTGPGPTRLKIAGHAENFPAAAIHRDLLQQKSLLSGTLRGDFYLEGEAGRNFIPTLDGGVSLEVRDGVLNKFAFLSKVFSLLNVSQLFAFKLPDLVEKGMPYQSLTVTVSIEQGIVHTEDLLLRSEAMDLSFVGDYDLPRNRLDAVVGVKPLKTVDRIITKIPIAGWILGGRERALVTAHFKITGDASKPQVEAIPVTSLSKKIFGIFKRVLTLPGEVLTDPGKVLLPQPSDPEK